MQGMTKTKSTCCYCGVGCGVIIESEGGRITGVSGDPDHPANFGRLCTKGSTLHLADAADARAIAAGVDGMRAKAKGMASGLEPELSVVVDVLFPIGAMTETAKEFRVKFPGTPLRLHWPLPDPAAAPPEPRLAAFRLTRDDISRRLDAFLVSAHLSRQ